MIFRLFALYITNILIITPNQIKRTMPSGVLTLIESNLHVVQHFEEKN